MALWNKLFGSRSSLPSNEMQGPAQWERRGESLQETIAARSAKLSGPNSKYTAVFDPRTLVEGSGPAQFVATALDGNALVSVKVTVEPEDLKNLRDAVSRGSVWFRSHCETYAEFPIVYSRLFIPLSAFAAGQNQVGMNGTIAENAGNFTNADLQDWAITLERQGRTTVHVYGTSNELLASGTAQPTSECVRSIMQAIDKANIALRKIPHERQNFDKAVQAFFRDHPEPNW